MDGGEDLNTELEQQIARSRAKSLLADGKWSHNRYSDAEMEDIVERVILSAIKRSYDLGYGHGATDQRRGDAAQPQRSEAEEIRYSKVGCKGGILAEGAHLEDEPQRSEQPDKWNLKPGQALPHLPDCKQGKACTCPYGYGENKRRNQLTKDYHVKHLNYEKLEQQLLSALAVLRRARRNVEHSASHQAGAASRELLKEIDAALAKVKENR